MNRTEKEQLVAELKEKLEGATALYYISAPLPRSTTNIE